MSRPIRVGLAVAVAVAVAACGGTRSTRSTPAPPTGGGSLPPTSGAVLPAGRLILIAQEPYTQGYAAGGSLYLAYTIPAAQHTADVYVLARLDPATGRAAATRRFASALDTTLLTRGSLWVTTSLGKVTMLWRLDPRSLAVRSRVNVPTSRSNEGITGSLAEAGGHLWVGTGTLDRVSLLTGRLDRVVTPPYRGPVQLAADPAGRVLLASLGYEHPTYIARLDPHTGSMLAHVTVPYSVSQPTLGGVIGGGAWIENASGSRTSAWRLDVSTLRATSTSAWPVASDRIEVRVLDGHLWVTQPLGQDNLNFCANPVTGRPRARLPLLPGDSVFLSADATSTYYTDVPVNAHSVKLERAPFGRACGS